MASFIFFRITKVLEAVFEDQKVNRICLDVNLVDTIRKLLVGTSSVIAPVAPSDVDKTIANDIISLVYE